MAFINFCFYSEALGMQTSANIVIPQRSTAGQIGIDNKAECGKYKCLYLLHGLSDDQTIWMRRTSIERYATQYGIAVVMPFGARSFYSDILHGQKYYTYIAKELPAIIEDMFNISPISEDRYIGGLSMGGYGALKTALTEKGRYAAAFGLSSVADIHNSSFTETLLPVFGGEIPDDQDLFRLTELHNSDPVKPRLYMTVGTSDFMYEDNLRLSRHISNLDYDYTYVETEGEHSWELWDSTVRDALAWMLA